MWEGRGYVEGLRQTDVRAGQGSGREEECDWDWGQREVGGGKMRTDSVVAYDQGVDDGVVVVDGGWWVERMGWAEGTLGLKLMGMDKVHNA
jgi:hypothetical protein